MQRTLILFILSTLYLKSIQAQIRASDLIVKYGWWSTKWYTLEGISNRHCKKEGKKINLTIKRGEKKLKKTFILRDLFLNNKQ